MNPTPPHDEQAAPQPAHGPANPDPQPNSAQPAADSISATSAAVALIACILGVAAFTLLAPILFPLIVAVFLFFVIRSITDAFVRHRIGRPVMYLTLFTLLLAATAGASNVLTANAQRFREVFPSYRARLIEIVNGWTGADAAATQPSSLSETLNVTLGDVMQFAFGHALSLAELLILVFFYLIFILLNADTLPRRVQRAFASQTSTRFLEISGGIRRSMQQYVRMKTLVSAGMAAVAAALMAPFQLDFWPLWAFLTFAFNYITYIGSLAALVPPIVVAFLQFDSTTAAITLSALLGVNRFVWIDYIEIRASGKGLDLDPILVLLALMYWGTYGGMLGLLLAVPMLTCLKITLAHFDATRRWAILMSEK